MRSLLQSKWLLAIMVGFAVALITYPVLIPDVGWEPDQSWAAALHMAVNQSLVFGRDLVFTYGPLGWLTTATMFFEGTGAVAIAIRFPILLAVAAVIWVRLRRVTRAPLAALGTVALSWLIGSVLLIGGESPLLVLFALIGPHFIRLCTSDSPPLPRWVSAALGSLGALVLLTKFDVGLYIVAWSLFMLVTDWYVHRQSWRRGVLGVVVLVVAFVASLLGGWVATGQPLPYLGDWLDLSGNLFFGFNDAMATKGSSFELQLAFASMVGLLVLAWPLRVSLDRRRISALYLGLVGAIFVFAKQGFLRHDGHSLRWWAFVGVASLALVRRPSLPLGGALAVLAILVASSIVGGVAFTNPSASIDSANRAWGQVISHAERKAVRSWGRRILPKTHPIPKAILQKMDGHSVHIGPVRAVVGWIYPKTTWKPFPILQHYHGFTPKLDRWTADFVRSKRAPQYVLYERFSIDARIDRWEPPETMLALLCQYRYVEGNNDWQLFQRRSKSACGLRRHIDTVDGAIGEEQYTPLGDPNELVVGSFSSKAFTPGVFRKLQWMVSRPPQMQVIVQNDPTRHRFVMGTAGQDHVLALPECLQGAMGGFDSGSIRSLTFTQRDGKLDTGPDLASSYDAITFDCRA